MPSQNQGFLLILLLKEYNCACLEAINAKERGDKKGQQEAGQTIRKLKQEISALGLSDGILASGQESPSFCASEDVSYIESKVNVEVEGCTSTDLSPEQNPVSVLVKALEEESRDVELGNFFLEDASSSEVLPPEVVNLQK
ncbi:RNA helicase family protein [Actinidia rufa]|uniref:RNA helicase family protein n=1 Tax=Actinidia rufa TaxID=165716 RepID=A0A7J0DW68_9ERIC|nr:RNA helicase family protein [Actinidia rufa]